MGIHQLERDVGLSPTPRLGFEPTLILATAVIIFLLSTPLVLAQGQMINVDWTRFLKQALLHPATYGTIFTVVGLVIISAGKVIGFLFIVFGLILIVLGWAPAGNFVSQLARSLV